MFSINIIFFWKICVNIIIMDSVVNNFVAIIKLFIIKPILILVTTSWFLLRA
jgi:hypothetical protein